MIQLNNQLISSKPRPIKSWVDGPWLLFNSITGFPGSGSNTMMNPVINKIGKAYLLGSIAIMIKIHKSKASMIFLNDPACLTLYFN
jgi:hypothetical protein